MMHKKRWAAFVLAAALVLTGCSAGSFLHFGKGSGGSTVQKIDRPAVESAELQFAHAPYSIVTCTAHRAQKIQRIVYHILPQSARANA